jgi:hypothetical protein
MSHEPGLRFWLHCVEREGGLVEDAGDHAIAVLPPRLRGRAGLAEEVTVTSNPDVAREDGALLLIAGHPELERAATSVLEPGDVGHVHLAWPAGARPRASDLQAAARETLDVAHGRIDAAGEPRATYLPVLRLGAMVAYSASLTQRFQEQDEVWIDARSALAVPAETLPRLISAPRDPTPDAAHAPLGADLPRALAAAHATLELRVAARAASLAGQARTLLERELAQVDAYYAGALESLARRSASAPPDRRRLLEDQAAATRAEHARRRREVHDEFRPRHEIRPFRLHQVLVPAFTLPVTVRRGARAYPFALTWLPISASLAPVRCPHCDADSPLVAGRERLGCRRCLAPPAAPAAAAAPAAPAAAAAPPDPTAAAASPAPDPPERSPSTAAARPPAGPRRVAPRAGGASRPGPSARPPATRPRRGGRRGGDARPDPRDTGPKLALAFWQAVANRERWPRRKVAGQSPLAALYRVYGAEGPLCALGVPPGQRPSEAEAGTLPGLPELVGGRIAVGKVSYAFVLSWSLEDGRAVLDEVMPSAHPLVLGPRMGGERASPGAPRLRGGAPEPGVPLDPVAAALWWREVPDAGLPLAIRCLATWWRVETLLGEGHAPAAIAAAVAAAVSRAAGRRRPAAALAAAYGSQPAAVRAVTLELGPALRLDPARGW